LNLATGNSTEPWGENGANVGNYHTSRAYGGIKLVQMMNCHGGIREVSHDGYGTKRQLYNFLSGMLAGIQAGIKES
jgi:hypothetical protein